MRGPGKSEPWAGKKGGVYSGGGRITKNKHLDIPTLDLVSQAAGSDYGYGVA